MLLPPQDAPSSQSEKTSRMRELVVSLACEHSNGGYVASKVRPFIS